MTIRKKLNVAGIVWGLIGVFIIFIWGPPQPMLEPHAYLLVDAPEYSKEIAQTLALRHRYTVLSRVGLACIAFGFMLQLVAEISDRPPSEPNDQGQQRRP